MRQFAIAGKTITEESDPFVIAEIGNNHQGRVDLCKHLMYEAKRAGADAVKLQKRFVQRLFTKKLLDAPYSGENSFGTTYGEHKEALDFDLKQWKELMEYAEKEDIFLFSTAFDVHSADFLVECGVKAFKIASGDLLNIPLIMHVASYHLPMVISTGGGSWEDVDRVYRVMSAFNAPYCILHCVASYPNRPEEMNLRVIPEMMKRYPEVVIGLSDHYPGSLMAISAYGMGAQVFEKHFTKDRTWRGPDHALSMEPWEMANMIHDMRRCRAAWGDTVKRRQECETAGLYKMGKGLYAARAVQAGHVLRREDIAIKSPAEGLPPHELWNVIGRAVTRELAEEDPITSEVIG